MSDEENFRWYPSGRFTSTVNFHNNENRLITIDFNIYTRIFQTHINHRHFPVLTFDPISRSEIPHTSGTHFKATFDRKQKKTGKQGRKSHIVSYCGHCISENPTIFRSSTSRAPLSRSVHIQTP